MCVLSYDKCVTDCEYVCVCVWEECVNDYMCMCVWRKCF